MTGHGEKLTRKQEAAIAALLDAPTVAAAAIQAGIGERTLRRWLKIPEFLSAYRLERRRTVESAVGRMQAGTGLAVDTLLAVIKDGAKASDRVRAANALLDYALRGVESADVLHHEPAQSVHGPPMIDGTGDIVKLLAGRLQQLDKSELPTGEKSRLTADLADALLRAIGVDVLDKRLAAVQAVLVGRKDE